ncbi:hypothetical protein EMMF5_005671 [Cystobasidiomycetes sp. EMM_F5]
MASAALISLAKAAPLPATTTSPTPADQLNKFTVSMNQFAAMYVNAATGRQIADLTGHITLVLGKQRVQALDNLGDDLCIAQFNQGQICGEAAAFAAAAIYAAEAKISMTSFGKQLGANRIKEMNKVLTTLCIAPDSNKNTCSVLEQNLDLFANAALDVPDPEGHSNPYTLSQAGVLILIDNAVAVATGSGANPGP